VISTFQRRANGQRGFTLIEVMAALVVFSLMTLGIVPLLLSSLKGSELSQSYAIGKNLAVEAMERVRGLPYYVKFDTQPDGRPIDLLDLYYPSRQTSGTFVTTCDETTVAAPACPKRVPEGYSIVFNATFVKPGGTAGAQTYTPIVADVPIAYAWNSADDLPASQILEMVITVEWLRGGETKQSQLKTLLSDRKFGNVTIRGNSKVDYGLEVQTGYIDPTGASSLMTATTGHSESLVESKTTTTANETVRSAELRLVEVPADPSTVGADIALTEGAKAIYHAPPNSSPSDTSLVSNVLTHPNLDPPTNIAGIDMTRAENVDVGVTNELPLANGSFALGNPGVASDDLWVAPQVSTERADLLKLNTTRPLFFIHPGATDAMTGSTAAVATDIAGADRKVETTSGVSLSDLRMLPTTFIGGDAEGAVVVIDNFEASVSCKSSGDPVSAGASATWSATLRYWQDTTNTVVGVPNGAYVTETLSGADGVDRLAEIRADNPLVHDGLTPLQDVYLFEDSVANKVGYLSDWGSLFDISSTGATEDALGETTTAAVDGALNINAAPTGTTAESGLKVNLGKLSCEAVDGR
jgi:prepilin-type N-terminal cleavage/methylation domain-containing protein